jgi:uncharacterized protein (DUF1499 family)
MNHHRHYFIIIIILRNIHHFKNKVIKTHTQHYQMKKNYWTMTFGIHMTVLQAVLQEMEALSFDRTRRRFFLSGLATPALISSCNAAETIGKDPNCNEGKCLGVWDGLLADCPHGKIALGGTGCVSSQDDTPGIFAEPWDYSESDSLDWEMQMKRLVPALQIVTNRRNEQMQVEVQEGRYLRVVFIDGLRDTSVGEFYFTPNDTTVQFRIASTAGFSSKLKNIDRAELIRKELRYLKLPVLRNRRRSLFFVESDLDTFGPGSTVLGPPAEMTTGELEGRQDVDPRLKIDLMQQFPFK